MKALLVAAAIVLGSRQAEAVQPGPVAGNPVIEVTGRIAKVELVRGQGMPSLEVKSADGRAWKVWLGSMRYLLERGFNPKAGQQVVAKGFKKPGAEELTAASVSLPETGQTLRLRDESGVPLWRGGRRGPR